jgi:Protein of unknown function DUF86
VSYRERQRLADIQAAIDAIRSHLQRGDLPGADLRRGPHLPAEIGEAVKALPDDLLATQPSIPWRQIARMRDHLAHGYDGHMVDTCRTVAPLGPPSGYSGAAWRIHGQGGMRNVRV